jgi:hypothetical protein
MLDSAGRNDGRVDVGTMGDKSCEAFSWIVVWKIKRFRRLVESVAA